MGVATTRSAKRTLAAVGAEKLPQPEFEPAKNLHYGGVLTLIPFLIAQGLLSYQRHYQAFTNGYYRLESIIMTLCYIYLCRFKNIEQLKNQKPGELGKLLGLDRVPEAKCMRLNVKAINQQGKAEAWNHDLTQQWIDNQDEEETLFYIDGHVYVYSGYKARLGKKHVARQKLCLAGLNEFWVHDQSHMPVMVVTGKVNEKLIEIIDQQILPDLNQHMDKKFAEQQQSEHDTSSPRFTMIFDREGYSPHFFNRLWKEHRIAVITYKKFVNDHWDEKSFQQEEVQTDGMNYTWQIGEKQYKKEGITLREIRLKARHEKQVALITTHPYLTKTTAARYLFNRWNQENFFRYARQDYALDNIMEYSVNELDENIKVVNPEYNKITHHIKKIREKISRKQAALYQNMEENVNTQLDQNPAYENKKNELEADLEQLQAQEQQLLKQRKEIKRKIPVKEMPQEKRYNTLNIESKHFKNILKMICYRAETAMVHLLGSVFTKNHHEGRMLVKEIIKTPVDLLPDYKNNTLKVKLYGLSTPKANNALHDILSSLNDSETVFPGTNLRLIYELGAL